MSSRHSSTSSADDKRGSSRSKNAGVMNVFQNDGSFLEMFKKMQNASQSEADAVKPTEMAKSEEIRPSAKEITQSSSSTTSKSAPTALFGRRRCTKALPVGKVKKLKTEDDGKKPSTTDAWAKYLEEVKKYKETYCDSEAKNRSLVK